MHDHVDYLCNDLASNEVDRKKLRLTITENATIKTDHGWQAREYSLAELQERLSTHTVIRYKDDAAVFMPGILNGERRKKSEVTELHLLVLDLDEGEDIEAIRTNIQKKKLSAIIYSTFYHLREKPGMPPKPAVARFRILFPLARPFRRVDCTSDAQFESIWKGKYLAFAGSIDLVCDASCAEISRAFFVPSCAQDGVTHAETIVGDLLDLDQVELPREQEKTLSRAITCRDGSIDLTSWISK